MEKMKKTGKEWCEVFNLRPTVSRVALFEAFANAKGPRSVPQLISLFAKKRYFPNKTTLYRELELLEQRGVVNRVQLSEERVSYELALDHHHHFVCQECDSVTKLNFCADALQKIEKLLQGEGKRITRHNFEFFGVCENC